MRKNEEGQVLIFLLLAMSVLILGAALVVDIGRLYVVRSQIQSAIDAAALAGVSQASAEAVVDSDGIVISHNYKVDASAAQAEAQRIFSSNATQMKLTASHGVPLQPFSITVPEVDVVMVASEANVKTYLAGPLVRMILSDDRFVAVTLKQTARAQVIPTP